MCMCRCVSLLFMRHIIVINYDILLPLRRRRFRCRGCRLLAFFPSWNWMWWLFLCSNSLSLFLFHSSTHTTCLYTYWSIRSNVCISSFRDLPMLYEYRVRIVRRLPLCNRFHSRNVTCFIFSECGMQQSRGKSHVTHNSVALHDQMLYNIFEI